MNYTVGEKELLGIFKGFKAFEGILQGIEVTVHTDLLNLLYRNLPSQRMVRWRLLLKVYHPFFKHVPGVKNDAADALCRLEMIFKASDKLNWEPSSPHLTYKHNRENNELCENMIAMSYTSSAIDKVSNEITAIDAAKLISEKYSDYEFALDVNMFHYHQVRDK